MLCTRPGTYTYTVAVRKHLCGWCHLLAMTTIGICTSDHDMHVAVQNCDARQRIPMIMPIHVMKQVPISLELQMGVVRLEVSGSGFDPLVDSNAAAQPG